jgi:RNA-binding protein
MTDQTDRSMQDLKPTVWIGKQGCTQTMIEEIVAQLKKRKLIKVKWLQNTDVDPEDISLKAKAKLMEVRGRTMVLAEKGKVVPGKSAKGGNPAKPTESARSRVIGKLKTAKK